MVYSICNFSEGCNFIEEGQAKISRSDLYTCCIGTCSVLCFYTNTHTFMTHIDPVKISARDIIDILTPVVSEYKIENPSVFFIPGPWCDNCNSLKVAQTVIRHFDWTNVQTLSENIEWKNVFTITKKGLHIS